MPTPWRFVGYRARDLRAVISNYSVIARRGATKQSRAPRATRDCFTEPVIAPRFARTRWLAMTRMSRCQLRRMSKIPVRRTRWTCPSAWLRSKPHWHAMASRRSSTPTTARRCSLGSYTLPLPLGEPSKASSLSIHWMCTSRPPCQTDAAEPLLQHDDTK